MKSKLIILSVLCFLVFISCDAFMDKDSTLSVEDLEETEVSIFNGDPGSEDIYSYQAQVTSYYSHDRKAIDMEPQQEYRLSMKVIGDDLYTRLDFSGDGFPDERARAVISGPEETLIVFSDSEQVEHRMPVESSDESFDFMTSRIPLLGRVDFERLRTTANRLSFDLSDDVEGTLTVGLPSSSLSEFFPPSDAEEVVSYSLNFDTDLESMTSSEMVIIEEDGTERTVTTYPVYEEDGDELIQKGTLTEIQNNVPGYGESESAMEVYDSVEDIPEITEEELEEMKADGAIIKEDIEVLLGDPNDPDYTETYVELYEDIELNTLEDSFFRIGM